MTVSVEISLNFSSRFETVMLMLRELNSSAAAAAVVANNTGTAFATMLESTAILSYAGFAFGVLMLFVWSGMWFIHLIAITYGKYRLYRHGVKSGDDVAASMQRVWPELGGRPPCISIIKPLVGVESNMLINLESFFLLNYPHECFELLFCVSEPQDPALMLVNTLVEKYPDVDATVFVGGMHVGVNPKINNMMPAYNAAKYALILVSDAGIYMRPNTLNNMVLTMDVRAGVVHQMPYTVDRCELGFPACLEKTFFGTAHARIYLAADVLGISCCTGMSCLYRKCVLDECGGFAAFGKHLAEDFFFAKAFTDRKWKLRLCTEPAWQNSSVCTVSYFRNRLQRWQRLRFAMLPYTILCEPFQENSFISVFAAASASLMFGISFWGFWIGHTLVWFVLDWLLLNVVQNGPVPYSKLEYTLAWLTREYMAPFLYFGAVLQPHIRWKRSVYKLKWGGEALLLPSEDDSLAGLLTKTKVAAAAAAATAVVVIDAESADASSIIMQLNASRKKMPTSISDYEDDGIESDNDFDTDDDRTSRRKTGDEEELLQSGSAAIVISGEQAPSSSRRNSSSGKKQPQPQRTSSLLYQKGRMMMLKSKGKPAGNLYDHTRFKNDDDDDDDAGQFDTASGDNNKYRSLKTPPPPPPPPPPLTSAKRHGHLQRNLNVVASMRHQQQKQQKTAPNGSVSNSSVAAIVPSEKSVRIQTPSPAAAAAAAQMYAETNQNITDDNNNLLLSMPSPLATTPHQRKNNSSRNSSSSFNKNNADAVVVVVGRPAASRLHSTSSSASATSSSSSSSSCSLVVSSTTNRQQQHKTASKSAVKENAELSSVHECYAENSSPHASLITTTTKSRTKL